MANITFESLPEEPIRPKICELDVGDTFLLGRAACMVVSIPGSTAKHVLALSNGAIWLPHDSAHQVQPVNVIAKVELP